MDLFYHSSAILAYPFARSEMISLAREQTVELYLQFGHGMMSHVRALLSEWGSGGTILSPRDMNQNQLIDLSREVRALNCKSYIDPQCYLRDADHARLTNHDFYQVFRNSPTNAFIGGGATLDLLEKLNSLNTSANTSKVILPGLLAMPVSEDWFSFQEAIITESRTFWHPDQVLATVAVSADSLKSEMEVEALIERAQQWDVSGFYLVVENPASYLIDDPVWLSNLMLLAAGLKLLGLEVIVGYTSHQMLCLAPCNVDAICSGTWINVRTFPTEKFYSPQEDEISRRTTWYYCPSALSEYKIPFLDIGIRNGVSDLLKPPPGFPNQYCSSLFAPGVVPTSVIWGEQFSFRHYLTTLRHQANSCDVSSFSNSVDSVLAMIDSASNTVRVLQAAGVFGQYRQFSDSVGDAMRAALTSLNHARGPMLRRNWK